MQNQPKYFIYARKSTDVEDKQVLSIEAQITELKKFAKDNGLYVVDTIIEKKSAKMPGRLKFGALLARIEAGEASGIISWHPDRLARNSIDGGQIVYLLVNGVVIPRRSSPRALNASVWLTRLSLTVPRAAKTLLLAVTFASRLPKTWASKKYRWFTLT